MVLKVLLTIMMAVPIILLGGYLLDKLMMETLQSRKKASGKSKRRDEGVELRNSYEYRSRERNDRDRRRRH